ncbi:MAG: MCP four helix bundle domain-containing protein, partial [Pseudomonadota bacterium]
MLEWRDSKSSSVLTTSEVPEGHTDLVDGSAALIVKKYRCFNGPNKAHVLFIVIGRFTRLLRLAHFGRKRGSNLFDSIPSMNLTALLRSFTIRTRMHGAIAMVLCLLVFVAGGGLYGIQSLQANNERFIATTHHDLIALGELRGALGNVRRFEKDMVINLDNKEATAKYFPKWQKSLEEAHVQAKALSAHQADEGETAAAQIDQALNVYTEAASPVLRNIMAAKDQVALQVPDANAVLGGQTSRANNAATVAATLAGQESTARTA